MDILCVAGIAEQAEGPNFSTAWQSKLCGGGPYSFYNQHGPSSSRALVIPLWKLLHGTFYYPHASSNDVFISCRSKLMRLIALFPMVEETHGSSELMFELAEQPNYLAEGQTPL
eukprot:1152170-Pelagomonas_calceolata.AAC.1